MSLAITRADRGREPRADNYLDSVAKLVPGEILAAYLAALQAPGVDGDLAVHLALVGIFAAATPLFLWLSTRHDADGVPWLQHGIRLLSFVSIAVGADPLILAELGRLRFVPSVGGALIVLFSAAILVPPASRPPPRPTPPPSSRPPRTDRSDP